MVLPVFDAPAKKHTFCSCGYCKPRTGQIGKTWHYLILINTVVSSQQQENMKCHSEKYLFTEYTHIDIYLSGSKNREWSPVCKLLLHLLNKAKINVSWGKNSSLLHSTIGKKTEKKEIEKLIFLYIYIYKNQIASRIFPTKVLPHWLREFRTDSAI